MDPISMCVGMGLCEFVPPGWHWMVPPIMMLMLFVIIGVPVAQILHRAGRSRWWTIFAFVPLLNLIGMWVFAFARWPSLNRRPG